MEETTRICKTCGAEMERKFYASEFSTATTPEFWVCPNREDGFHPDPGKAEPTGRP